MTSGVISSATGAFGSVTEKGSGSFRTTEDRLRSHPAPVSASGTTSENDIGGGQIGIGVVADIANTVGVLHEDDIHGTTVAPVREFSCCGFKATAIVK
jgi:hypothetical protein